MSAALDFSGLRATVMGLGLHGGGLSAARFLSRVGAEVTVTDLRDERALASSVAQLPAGVRTVLGRHEREDFTHSDLVVKNPAVPRHAELLNAAVAVTTDIALFLAEWRARLARHGAEAGIGNAGDTYAARLRGARTGGDPLPPGSVGAWPNGAPSPLVAVTGTKGKSTTSAACAHILRRGFPGVKLGGNITVSPLDFADELSQGDPVVLELSSFQLGDLAWCRTHNARMSDGARRRRRPPPDEILYPTIPADVAVITNILRDHQDYYGSMDSYVEDKREIYRHMSGGTLLTSDLDAWGRSFLAEVAELYPADAVRGEAIDLSGGTLVPQRLRVPGRHARGNTAYAARAAELLGMSREEIRIAAGEFGGVPHRLELVADEETSRWVNDTAATIPDAALEAVESFSPPIVLIAGGSDKRLELDPLVDAVRTVTGGGGIVLLLSGDATDRLIDVLRREELPFTGPYVSLETACRAAREWAVDYARTARAGTSAPLPVTVLLSPGAASFGMFKNEFDRGDRFRAIARGAH